MNYLVRLFVACLSEQFLGEKWKGLLHKTILNDHTLDLDPRSYLEE